jgi:uncharacterized protein YabN with tetrapyrrole methylase and pyrophosphatase domain
MADTAPRGSLVVVGTGIRPPLHTTTEAIRRIERADRVLYLLVEQAPSKWIHERNPSARSLAHLYVEHEVRADVYEAMVEEVLAPVREGLEVCFALYGHPGVFVSPSQEAIARARAEGFPATMLPGISAEDCLFADLGVDPADRGCQSYEATDLLIRERRVDPAVPLVVWQISVIGRFDTGTAVNHDGLEVLTDRLAATYGEDHEVVIYEASPFPVGPSHVERIRLGDLPGAAVTPMSTLYVPPDRTAPVSTAMMERLGIPRAR